MSFPVRLITAVLLAVMVFTAAPRAGAESHTDAAFWNSVKNSREAFDYEAYLDAYPRGRHAGEAQRRVSRFGLRDERLARERALGLNRGQRREVEERLARAGLNPGSINGRFNRDTRRAIARFRKTRNLPVHGFLDRPMIRRLVRETGDEYTQRGFSGGSPRDGDVAAGVAIGALLLGGIILLSD